jgi:RNA polymerase sigma factor (sigma-70 family)
LAAWSHSRATSPSQTPDEVSFARLYDENWAAVLAYGLRRTRHREDAADLMAETFLVAWRRRDEVPPGEEARLWLYGVARRVLANQGRGQRRRLRLVERLRHDLSTSALDEPANRVEPAAMKALGRMDKRERELLLLAGWEELAPAEIAAVLAIPPATARTRLRRARKRFKLELEVERGEARPATSLETKHA